MNEREAQRTDARKKILSNSHADDHLELENYLCIAKPFVTYYQKGLQQQNFPDGRPVDSGECYLEFWRNCDMRRIKLDVRLSSLPSKIKWNYVEILKISFDEDGLEDREAVFSLESVVMFAIFTLYGQEGQTRIITSGGFDYAGVVGIPAIKYFINRFQVECDKSMKVAVVQEGNYNANARKQHKKYMKSLHKINNN